MREAGALIGLDSSVIYWHIPFDRTGAMLPDSRSLWDVIWENRENVLGFAHSHPGSGMPGPSYEDVTSFSPIELGLGRRLQWWITSSDRLAVVTWVGPDAYSYRPAPVYEEPSWLNKLRLFSVEQQTQPSGGG
jgi:hypothetical protein